MNKISTKIQTYYDIMSPQVTPNLPYSFEVPKIPLNESPISSSWELNNHLRIFTPEVFLHSQEANLSQFDWLRNFTSEDAQKSINKEVLKKPLLLCLEGFNAGLIVIEPLNQEKNPFTTNFFSLLFSCLNYLKKVCQDFKRDGINSSFKLMLMMRKDGCTEDLLAESFVEGNPIQERFFMEIDELIKYINNVVVNSQYMNCLDPNDALILQTEVFFSDVESQLCWKGRLVFAGFLSENAKNELEELAKWIKPHSKFELQTEDFEFNKVFQELFSKNVGMSRYFEEGSEEESFAEELIETVADKFARMSFKLERNKLNDISDYLKTIEGLQKTVAMKEYELSAIKLTEFLKDKENDELKIQVAQLESNIALMEEEHSKNVSILEDEIDSKTSIKYSLETEGNLQAFNKNVEVKTNMICRQTENKLNISNEKTTENSNEIIKSDTHIINMGTSSKLGDFMQMEGQEHLLEINYFDELNLLRERFHKLNKENSKLKLENDDLKLKFAEKQKLIEEQLLELEELKSKQNESRSLVSKYQAEQERLKEKNLELQKELIDMYEIYAKKEFRKRTNKV